MTFILSYMKNILKFTLKNTPKGKKPDTEEYILHTCIINILQ